MQIAFRDEADLVSDQCERIRCQRYWPGSQAGWSRGESSRLESKHKKKGDSKRIKGGKTLVFQHKNKQMLYQQFIFKKKKSTNNISAKCFFNEWWAKQQLKRKQPCCLYIMKKPP